MTLAELERSLETNERQYLSREVAAFEHLLRASLDALDRIRDVENTWHRELMENRLAFDADFDRLVVQKYRQWRDHAKRRLEQLEIEEIAGSLPSAAVEFRQRVEEVEDDLDLRSRAESIAEARSAAENMDDGEQQ